MEGTGKTVLAAFAIVAIGAGGWYVYQSRLRQPPPEPLSVAPSAPAPAASAPAVPMPPLDQSDDLVREKAKGLSSSPALAEWLAKGDIARRLVAAADAVGRGDSPLRTLDFLSPAKKISVKKKGKDVVLLPASYSRYDGLAGAIASIDAPAAGRVFEDLRPLFQSACDELGYTRCDVKEKAGKAIAELLKAPVVSGDIRLRKKIVSYAFADPKLERLSAAQKHMIRLGPENEAKVQAKLREIARAMGIPDDQLPSAR